MFAGYAQMATLVVNWCEEVEEVERARPSGSKPIEDEAHYLRVRFHIAQTARHLCASWALYCRVNSEVCSAGSLKAKVA